MLLHELLRRCVFEYHLEEARDDVRSGITWSARRYKLRSRAGGRFVKTAHSTGRARACSAFRRKQRKAALRHKRVRYPLLISW